jgi:hypothetical protein
MNRKTFVVGAMLALFAAPILAQEPKKDEAAKPAAKPQDAKVMLDAALKKAKEQKKNVLVVFDASW